MKLPKSFLPSKNLEEKTEQLLESARTYKTTNICNLEYLNTAINYWNGGAFNIPTFHVLVGDLIRNSNYKPFNPKLFRNSKKFSYWTMPDPTVTDYTRLLIRKPRLFGLSRDNVHYNYALLEKKDLKNFCKNVEKAANIKQTMDDVFYNDRIKIRLTPYFLALGFVAGAGLSVCSGSYPLQLPFTIIAGLGGCAWNTLVLSFAGDKIAGLYAKQDKKRLEKYKHKYKKYPNEIALDTMEAIIKAFT